VIASTTITLTERRTLSFANRKIVTGGRTLDRQHLARQPRLAR
jgi:hypothetical protein